MRTTGRVVSIILAFTTAGLACGTLAACGQRAATPALGTAATARDQLNTLQALMIGSFSSAAQSQADPDNYMDIRLHMARVWPQRTDGIWLYVEQATAARPDRPYRQRVYRLTTALILANEAAGTHPGRSNGAAADAAPAPEVMSEVYVLPGDPLLFAGAWREKDGGPRFASLTPEQLEKREGCTVYLTLRDEADGAGPPPGVLSGLGGTFVGGTRGTGCASDLRGASHATSEVEIGPDGLRTWDRGFDGSGTQVWGAEKGPYVFTRVGEQLRR